MVHLVKWAEKKILCSGKDRTEVLSKALSENIVVSGDLQNVSTITGVNFTGNSFNISVDKTIQLYGYVVFDDSYKYLLWDH